MTSERPADPADRPLRVLMVAIRYPEVEGGVDAMVRDLITGLGRRAEVELFVPGDWSARRLASDRSGPVPRHSRRLRMPVDRARPVSGFLGWLGEVPRTLHDLVGLLRAGRFDLVHLHTVTNYAAWFRLAAALAGRPYVVTLHGSDVTAFASRRADERALIRWALGGAAAIVAVSQALSQAARARFALNAPPVVIRNGIDLDLAGADAAAPAAAAQGPYVLSAGALDRVKGHDLLIRAWAALAQRFPAIRLVLAGDGDEGAALRRLAGELGVAARIEFAGALPRPAVLRLLRGALVFVLPSRSEGLPYALLEAGAAGRAVVATSVGGMPEVVGDDAGILVPSEDPAALAEAIARALGDADLRARLGGALQARVRAEFSSRAMADGYLAVYEGVRRAGST